MDWNVSSESGLRAIERLNVLAGISVVLAAAVLGGGAFAASAARASATANVERTKMQASKDRHDAATTTKAEPRIPLRAEDQVTAVQARLGAAAAKYGVTLTVFDASGETLPYASRYGSTIAGAGWTMVNAQAQMSGPTNGVYRTLRAMRKGAVPIEIVAFSIRPIEDESGRTSAEASVTLLIIVRPAELLRTSPQKSGAASAAKDAAKTEGVSRASRK